MLGSVVHGAASAEAASSLPSALVTRESKRFRRPGPTRPAQAHGQDARQPRRGRTSAGTVPGTFGPEGEVPPGRRRASREASSEATPSGARPPPPPRAAALTRWRAWRSIGAPASPGAAADSAPRGAALPLGPARRWGAGCIWEPGAPKMRAPARELFRDPAFPASDSSLFSSFSTPLAQFREDITWRRPQVSGWRGVGSGLCPVFPAGVRARRAAERPARGPGPARSGSACCPRSGFPGSLPHLVLPPKLIQGALSPELGVPACERRSQGD